MNAKNDEVLGEPENKIKGTVGEQSAPLYPALPEEPEAEEIRDDKASVAYWKTKLKKRTYVDGTGRTVQLPEYYLRVKKAGRVAWFNLHSSNVTNAGAKARDLWLRVQGQGLDAVIAAEKPKPDKRLRSAKVGDLIKCVEGLALVRERTRHQYFTALRRVVSGVMEIEAPAARYAPFSDANREWRAKVDGVPLDKITPAAVEAWRAKVIAAAPDELTRDRRSHSRASNIRNCKALFSKALMPHLREKLHLPDPLPFAGLSTEATTRRFDSKVDPAALYSAAKKELKKQPDTLTAFLLLITAGLRRAEADLLPWSHIDLENGKLAVRATEWFQPKTEESTREIPLPPDVIKFLKARRKKFPDAVFVLEGGEPLAPGTRYEYRANAWEPLTAWLKSKGVMETKALHALRGHSGSIIAQVAGIEAARRHLGHANISTTSASYVKSSVAVVDFTAKKKASAK